MIEAFRHKYRFLSNFAPCTVQYQGKYYLSVEAAYQAAKSPFADERVPFQSMDAVTAKRAGRFISMRKDWPSVRKNIMLGLCRQKFDQEPFKQQLLETGNQHIMEGNTWGDTYWGVYQGFGENHLGRILMQIREELKENHDDSSTQETGGCKTPDEVLRGDTSRGN